MAEQHSPALGGYRGLSLQLVNAIRHKTCGSDLARDDGLTFNIDIDCYDAIASKLAPTG